MFLFIPYHTTLRTFLYRASPLYQWSISHRTTHRMLTSCSLSPFPNVTCSSSSPEPSPLLERISPFTFGSSRSNICIRIDKGLRDYLIKGRLSVNKEHLTWHVCLLPTPFPPCLTVLLSVFIFDRDLATVSCRRSPYCDHFGYRSIARRLSFF